MPKNKITKYPDWTKMTRGDKIDMFSDILTRAVSEIRFRERCLASKSSAIAAVAEYCDLLPHDFSITFVDSHEQDETTSNRAILLLPEWRNAPYTVKADGTNVICTYAPWRKTQPKRRPKGKKH